MPFIQMSLAENERANRQLLRSSKIIGAPVDILDAGKLKGYAYRNLSKSVFGQFRDTSIFGALFLAASAIFCWAIFPLFVHLPMGVRLLRMDATIRRGPCRRPKSDRDVAVSRWASTARVRSGSDRAAAIGTRPA